MARTFIILGMHKSGTTLLSRILHHSGIEMVEETIDPDYDQGNQYERKSTNSLNKRLLGGQKQNSSKVRNAIDAKNVEENLKTEAIRLFGELDGRNCDWGFKDPRTCLTYEFLAPLLPRHKVIAIFRDPRAVHRHYIDRNRGKWGIGVSALRAWSAYNRLIIEVTKKQNYPALLVNYDLLMQDDTELHRIEKFTGSKSTDQRIASLKRNENSPGLRFNIDNAISSSLFGTDVLKLFVELCFLRDGQVSSGIKPDDKYTKAKMEERS
ncbi:MAG: sulfotransferase [Pseudomonadota bacterium]